MNNKSSGQIEKDNMINRQDQSCSAPSSQASKAQNVKSNCDNQSETFIDNMFTLLCIGRKKTHFQDASIPLVLCHL